MGTYPRQSFIVITGTKITRHIGREVTTGPRVSVIIPAFMVSTYIADTLVSVIDQTYTQFEILVVNDGSPDTLEFEREIEPFIDKIIYIKQPQSGAGIARNTGIEHARGELLAFLDGDDVWLPEYLEKQVALLDQNGMDMVYADAFLFGEVEDEGHTFMEKAPSDGEVTFEKLVSSECNVILSGSVVKRKAVINVGGFNDSVRGQDFNLWLKLCHNGAKIGYQKIPLLKYRVRIGSVSGNSIQRVQREIDQLELVKKTLDLNKSEIDAVYQKLHFLDVEQNMEKGKSFLLARKFGEAKVSFKKANSVRRSFFLSMLVLFLTIAPSAVLFLFSRLRKKEIPLIVAEPTKNSQNI